MENALTRRLGTWRRRLLGHGALDRFYAQHQTDLELLLRAEAVPPSLVEAYRQLTAEAASGVTWDHLHRLEGLLLQAAPEGYQRLALATIRVRFKALAPTELYEEYVKLVTPRVDEANRLVAPGFGTRDEGIYLLSQLQRLRVLHAEYSRARRFIFLLMPVVVGAYLGLLNLVVYVSRRTSPRGTRRCRS